MSKKNTVIVTCYRYIWKTKDGNLCVKYVTDIDEGHARFMKALCEDENIISAMREYQHEVNYAFIGFTEGIKKENKEKTEELK